MIGIAPSEFLQMTPSELALVIEARTGKKAATSDELDELREFIHEED